MNPLELREKLGNRTYEAGRRLLEKNAVSLESRIADCLSVYLVRDKPPRHVVLWNRKGSITAECECTPNEMGCRHCACVYMSLFESRKDHKSDVDGIRRAIEELAATSFDTEDYLDEASMGVLMTQFYNFIQKKIDRKIGIICKAIEEFSEGKERDELYRKLDEAVEGFESPHDEWSRDTILSNGGDYFSKQ